ncbi:hypothetical protein [Chryseobacterium oryctis]|uniref:DoxX-like family protein n=1 Tax=Chryseobacterium oryctis TaxID=2952618 RepID=A0ABT3HPK0_9FLAO|nr:hypothetical protein [Chryseobacterium oryctis]MCW3161702.1 hypothetical protein [Chryseobacterium oryctis]
MKIKILIFLLIITSLFGYLEWGGNNKSFLAEAEYSIFRQLIDDPKKIIHPFILLPLFGQLLLLFTLFQKIPNKILIYIGLACLSLLLGFMFFISILTTNFKTLASTLPFLTIAILTVKHLKNRIKQ